jgi:hypothetical protein
MEFEQLETAAFWRELMPDLAVQPDHDQPVTVLTPNETTSNAMLRILDREGYVQLPRSQDVEHMAKLARLVEAVRALGLPPVFSFIYDEMWQPYRRLGPVIDCLLRGRHAMMPHLWAWYIDPGNGEAGWTPHCDRPGRAVYADLRPKAITIWIPLTEATTLNGCMYLIPKHRDNCYGQIDKENFNLDLADIRALPAVPGDSLIWTQDVTHWGSRTSEMAKGPRLSMSVEFQRRDEPPLSNFVIRPDQGMTFERKLALIGHAIVNYQHMHRLDGDLVTAARRWRGRIPALFGLGAIRLGDPSPPAHHLAQDLPSHHEPT